MFSIFDRIKGSEVKELHSKLAGKDYLLLTMLYSFHKLNSELHGEFIGNQSL